MQQRTMKWIGVALGAMILMTGSSRAQINTCGDGSDGVFNPTDMGFGTTTNINMNSRPSGIYQYTSVFITNGVTVTFTNVNNYTPIIWLVQSNVTINGIVDVSGKDAFPWVAGSGGPGGGGGGNAVTPEGQGTGGGGAGTASGGCASYGGLGTNNPSPPWEGAVGKVYGNNYLIPLLGGSGGGRGSTNYFGGGGGGAILIATSGSITINGSVLARGGKGGPGGHGSGGGIRLVASAIGGSGTIDTSGGGDMASYRYGGVGRVRFDTYTGGMDFGGSVSGVYTQGNQFVIIPSSGAGAQLLIASVAGVAVSSTPGGVLLSPDVFISALQTNPIPIVVQCTNVPMGSAITVTITPANGAPSNAILGYNNSGTPASSTATVLMTMPRGGGYISATVTAGD